MTSCMYYTLTREDPRKPSFITPKRWTVFSTLQKGSSGTTRGVIYLFTLFPLSFLPSPFLRQLFILQIVSDSVDYFMFLSSTPPFHLFFYYRGLLPTRG